MQNNTGMFSATCKKYYLTVTYWSYTNGTWYLFFSFLNNNKMLTPEYKYKFESI